MIKIWGKTIKKNKITKSHTVEHYGVFSEDVVMDGIYSICVKFDMPRPIVLNKHSRDINEFLMVKFFPEDFIEKVDFDRFEIEIFIEKKKDGE
jgi:hypothetical protein